MRIFLLSLLLFVSLPSRAGIEALADSLFAKFNKSDAPGCFISIVQEGKVIFSKGYGLADVKKKIPLTAQSTLHIGSTSKQFTAMAILLLEERGQLKRSDDIRKYLPGLPAYEKPITIRHLLNHTSGLRDYLELRMLLCVPDKPKTWTMEFRDHLVNSQEELNFSPGEQFMYSNTNYYLLGRIIEKVSGMHAHAFIRKEIFEPLGMTHTYFLEEPARATEAKGYYPGKKIVHDGGRREEFPGEGGIVSSADDLLLWDQNFYDNRLGKKDPQLIARMHERGVLNSGDTIFYANGLMCFSHLPTPVVMHGGDWRGFHSQLIRFPEKKLSLVCLSNYSSSAGDLPERLALLCAGIPPQQTIAPAAPAIPPARLAGYYLDAGSGEYRVLRAADGKLYLGSKLYELLPLSPARWHLQHPSDSLYPVRFQFDTTGAQTKLRWTLAHRGQDFVRRDSANFNPGWFGKYRCKELDGLEIKLVMKKEKTVAIISENRFISQVAFVESGGFRLSSFDAWVEMTPEDFRLHTSRVKRLAFVKFEKIL